MKLYFYCSSGSLLEYFTINKIVCNDYLTRRNRKVIHSLGLVSDKFLFFSKHRLLAEKRVYGFEKDYMEIPAIIEISVSEDDAKNIPVLFVDGEGKAAEEYGILADWKEEYNGFFIKGELPFSYVSRILFDNDNAKDDIYRPSKDLYFPEHLYDVVDDTFSEDMLETGDPFLQNASRMLIVDPKNKDSNRLCDVEVTFEDVTATIHNFPLDDADYVELRKEDSVVYLIYKSLTSEIKSLTSEVDRLRKLLADNDITS